MPQDPERPRPTLARLYTEIEQRAADITAQRPDWPCRKGCDHCCRNLAEPPRLSRPEWQQIEEGLEALSAADRRDVEELLDRVAHQPDGPVCCPFLDPSAGACRIYAHRPAACRTYGYYRDRDGGRFCSIIETKIATEGDDDLVWGNHHALERRLEQESGPAIPLQQWWAKR